MPARSALSSTAKTVECPPERGLTLASVVGMRRYSLLVEEVHTRPRLGERFM